MPLIRFRMGVWCSGYRCATFPRHLALPYPPRPQYRPKIRKTKKGPMPTQELPVGDTTHHGYLALPQGGKGPGVLVCHAWWGLNQVFTDLCDLLAAKGYVAFAPDLYDGKIVSTIEDAE